MVAFFRKLTLRRRLEREMHDELAFHIEARTADLEASGIPHAEAIRRARVEFGGVERYKEQLRQDRRFTGFEDFTRDLVYAVRNLRRSPLFVLSAAGAIARGIGLNTALFSLVYGVLFRPLPVADPGNVRSIYLGLNGAKDRSTYESQYFVSWEEFQYLRAHARTASLAGISDASVLSPVSPGALHAELVSSNLLALCGAHPVSGRFFQPGEDAVADAGAVVVLSYDAWQKYFHGEQVVGKPLVINRTPFTIVGVANQGFYGPGLLKADLWFPLSMQPIARAGEPLINNPNAAFIHVLARLRPGQNNSSVRAELQVLAQQTISDHAPGAVATILVSPAAFLNQPDMMQQSVPVLAILFLTVSLVLLAACANVANMLVARGFSRAREISIRASMGAGKWRIVRQLLTEHLILGLLGGAAGLLLAQVAIRSAVALLPGLQNQQVDLSPDWRIAAWTALTALTAGALFGLPAALGIVRGDLAQSVRGSAFEAGRKRRFRLQTLLTAAQVAISALLLVNAALLGRAALHAIHLDPGYAASGILAARPNLRESQYAPARAEQYIREFRGRALALPGVTGISWTGFEPVRSSCDTIAATLGPDGQPGATFRAACNEIGPDYFRVMHIRLLEGRAFDASDEMPAAKTAIVDENFARRYLPGNPLGRRIRTGGPGSDREVVGVVASIRNLMPMSIDRPEIYTPLVGLRYLEAWMVVSYGGNGAPVARALQSLPETLDRGTSLTVHTIEENIAIALLGVRVAAGGVAGLGVLALLLACAGVYGVVAFTVGRRRREIGIRMALGAEPRSIVRLLVWQSLRPALAGGAIGAALAIAAAQAMHAMLYGVSPADPLGLAAALVLLAAIAAVAAFVPASAAMRVDPAVTLRHD